MIAIHVHVDLCPPWLQGQIQDLGDRGGGTENQASMSGCKAAAVTVVKKLFLGSWRLDACNSGTVWNIVKPTVPLRAAKGALHDGVNIAVCENNSKRSVFSDPVT